MQKLNIIALDGPSGAGKSTTAKRVAQALGWDYLDTGAMYRTTALALHRQGMGEALADSGTLARILADLRIEQRDGRFYLGAEDVSDAIRMPEITRMVTPVSANPQVREALVHQQRLMAGKATPQRGWVVDGRDIGTVVFPDACCKIYLVATVEARARRRYLELESKGIPTTQQEVADDIARRDHADMTRAVAPLTKAPDASELDSSHLTLHEVVEWIIAHHRAHG